MPASLTMSLKLIANIWLSLRQQSSITPALGLTAALAYHSHSSFTLIVIVKLLDYFEISSSPCWHGLTRATFKRAFSKQRMLTLLSLAVSQPERGVHLGSNHGF